MAPASIQSRLQTLYGDLENIDPQIAPSWPVCEIFNALLEEVKKDHGDDPVVKVIESVTRRRTVGPGESTVLTIRVAANQLANVFGERLSR
jgi:hypothetical protein